MHWRVVLERDPTLVWIASYPKSGNTWLRMFLKAYLGDGTVDINNYAGAATVGDITPGFYEAVSPVPLEEVPERECFYLRPAALYRLSRLGPNVLVKTHCANSMVQGIELIPKELSTGAIYVVRDPRDVCISYADHMGASIDKAIERLGDPMTMAQYHPVMQYLSTWSHNVESWAEEKAFPLIFMRYEDMLENPVDTFRHAAYFINGSVDEEALRRAVEATSFDRLKKQEEEKGFGEKSPKAEKFFREGRSTWRDVLTKAQRKKIEEDHGKVMKKLGYEL